MSLVSEYQQNTSQHWPGSLGGILDKCAWYWQTAMHLDGPSTICSDSTEKIEMLGCTSEKAF